MQTIDHAHQRQSVSLQVIKSFISRSGQDQIRSKGISHFVLPFILVKFLSSQFRNANFSHGAFHLINQFGHRGCFKALVLTVNTSCSLSFFCVFSCCLRATFLHSNSREAVVASRRHSCFILCLAVASRQQSWSIRCLSFILFIGLVNCSFPGVPTDTLEYSSL